MLTLKLKNGQGLSFNMRDMEIERKVNMSVNSLIQDGTLGSKLLKFKTTKETVELRVRELISSPEDLKHLRESLKAVLIRIEFCEKILQFIDNLYEKAKMVDYHIESIEVDNVSKTFEDAE